MNTPNNRNPWILPLGPVTVIALDGTVTMEGLLPVDCVVPTEAGEVAAATIDYAEGCSGMMDYGADCQEGGGNQRTWDAANALLTKATTRLETLGIHFR